MPEVVGRLRTPRLAAAPASPAAGELYYDTGGNLLYWWNGAIWVAASGGGSGLPADTVVPAGTRIISNKLAAGDTQPDFVLDGSGKMSWGLGGASAPAANLQYTWQPTIGGYRLQMTEIAVFGAGFFQNQGLFNQTFGGSTANDVRVGQNASVIAPAILFALDTTLGRSAAGVIDFGKNNSKGAIRMFGSAATDLLISHLVTTDANPRFTVAADGTHAWGIGSAAADISLYRNANLGSYPGLYTNGSIVSAGVTAWQSGNYAVGLGLPAGAAASPNTFVGLTYDTTNNRADLSALSGGVAWRDVLVGGSANLLVNKILFGTANANFDTNLYRLGANALATNGALYIDQANTGYAVYFGSAGDTYLNRQSAGVLGTNGGFVVGGQIQSNQAAAGGIALFAPNLANDGYVIVSKRGADAAGWRFNVTSDGGHYWGPGGASGGIDTNLYRNGVASLKTDGAFYVRDGAVVDHGGSGSRLYFGSALDTGLYRAAAGILKTDGKLQTAGDISLFTATGDTSPEIIIGRNYMGAGKPGIAFGVGGTTGVDVYLYRDGAFTLRTNGSLTVDTDVYVGGKVTGNGTAPPGGTTGQVLAKRSASDYDVGWTTPAGGSSSELAYAELTAPLTVAGTTEAAATVVVTAPSVTFDGATPVMIEFFSGNYTDTGSTQEMHFYLYDNGVSLGRIAYYKFGTPNNDVFARRRLTPGSGAHVFDIRASKGSSTGGAYTINAGAGGVGTDVPAFIRLSVPTARGPAGPTGPAGGAMSLIQEIVVAADGQANVDFSGIPQTYRHLAILYVARSSTAGLASYDLACQFNGDTAANYDWEKSYAAATTTTASEGIAATWGVIGYTTGPTATTTTRFARGKIDIPYYTDAFEKDAVGDFIAPRTTASGNTYRGTVGAHWRQAAAITRVVLFPATASAALWAANSKISLYGVT